MIKIKCNKCGAKFNYTGSIPSLNSKVKIKVKCFNCDKMIEVKLYEEEK